MKKKSSLKENGDRGSAPSTTAGRNGTAMDTSDPRDILSNLTFDGVPLRDSLFSSLFQSAEDTEKRLAKDSGLLSAFRALEDVDFPGISVDEMLRRTSAVLTGKPADQLEALMSACNADESFFKCTNVNESVVRFCQTSKIAMRISNACVHVFEKNADPSYALPPKSFFADRSTKPEDKIVPRQVECLRKLLDHHTLHPRGEKVRQMKCSKCHRMAAATKNDLEVQGCATCVRVYHKQCMTAEQLATDPAMWPCHKCAEAGHSALRRMIELQEKLNVITAKRQRTANKRQKTGGSGLMARQNSRQLTAAAETAASDSEALREAKQRLKTETSAKERQALQMAIDGPKNKYTALFPSQESFDVFNMASSVAEFLSLYGDICELEKVMDTHALLQAARWPLHFSLDLMVLYSQLLLCCLLEQHNHDGLSKTRARKWMRVLSNSTWPEILRRYISQRPVARLHRGDKDRLARAQKLLSTNAWFEMPVDLHLFLLHVLCHDIAQGQALKTEMCAPPREYRTDNLGVDRYGRRYWLLRGSPGIIAIEDDKGNHAGAITSGKDLRYLMDHLLRRGPGEGILYTSLLRMRGSLEGSFNASSPSSMLVVDNVDWTSVRGSNKGQKNCGSDVDGTDDDGRADGNAAKGSDEDKVRALTAEAIDEARVKLEDVLHDVGKLNPQLEELSSAFLKKLEESPCVLSSDMCRLLLDLEAVMAMAGEGLPPFGTNDDVRTFLEDDALLLPELVEASTKTEAELEENRLLGLKSLKPFLVDPENPHGDNVDLDDSDDPNPPKKSIPVDQDDDYDCSDAEHTYLREKRMRKPARLWRSGRERSVWVRGVLDAAAATDAAAASSVAFAAYILGDRILLLGERCKAIEKELARQEEKELMKQQLLEEEQEEAKLKAQDRPLMIVTEEEDVEDADNVEDVEDVEDGDGPTSVEAEPGMKLVQIGRDPRALRDATQEDINACKWEYRCRLCDRVGELICCEHDEGCCVSMHIRCTAVSESALTTGKWVCLNHDDTRRRRKKRALHGDMHFTADDEDTVSEETYSV